MPALKVVDNRDRLPKVQDVSPAYVELHKRATSIGNEVLDLRAKLRTASDAAGMLGSVERVSEQDEAAKARVASILGREPPARAQPKHDYETDILTLSREIKDREAALVVLEREMDQERRAASAIIMKQIDPIYREIVAKICKCFIQLHQANREYEEFADHLNLNDISWSGRGAMSPWFIGSPTDPSSNLARYLREAIEAGLLRSSEMPAELVG